MTASEKQVLDVLETVPDPEVPAISVVDLGIVRGVDVDGDSVTVRITPTYSGCPAMRAIENDIQAALRGQGFADVQIKTVFSPPWSTDMMSEDGKRKLREYGIAPPTRKHDPLAGPPQSVPCPFCESNATELRSEFGSTACKALYFCNGCHQPFEHFKCV